MHQASSITACSGVGKAFLIVEYNILILNFTILPSWQLSNRRLWS